MNRNNSTGCGLRV